MNIGAERAVDLNTNFPLFDINTIVTPEEYTVFTSSIKLRSHIVPEIDLCISACKNDVNDRKVDFITSFDIEAGTHISISDWRLEERIRKLQEEDKNEALDLNRVPLGLLIDLQEEEHARVTRRDLFDEQGNFHHDVWNFLYRLRLMVSVRNLTLVSTEAEDLDSDEFYFLHFVPVDSPDLDTGYESFQKGISAGVYLTPGWRVGLPAKLEEVKELIGRFALLPNR